MNAIRRFFAVATVLSVVLAGFCAHGAPISYWAFDDGPGSPTAANAVGGSPAGTLWNMDPLTDWVPSMAGFGTALDFDGANDFVDVVQDISETANAVSLWFRTSAGGAVFSVNQPRQGGANDRNLWVAGGNVYSRIWSEEWIGSAGSGINFADGAWHHVVRQYGPSGHEVYVDGALQASGIKASSNFNWQTNLEIGWSNFGGYFTGQIDDVAVWNERLTPGQISALTSGVSPLALPPALSNWVGATASWHDGTQWDTNPVVPGPPQDAVVGNGGTAQISALANPASLTIGPGTVEVNGGNLDTPDVTVGAGGTLVLGGGTLTNVDLHIDGGALTSTVGVNSPQPITLDAGGGTIAPGAPMTLSGPIDGLGSLTKDGAGTLTLTGPNTYNGATNIVAGTLRIEAGAPAGALPAIPSLALHLDASDPASVPQVAGPVGVWTDLVAGNNVVQGNVANQPTFVPGVLAGSGVVRFDGDDVLSNTFNVGNPYTMFSVQALEGSLNRRLVTSTTNNWLMGFWGGGKDRMYAQGWVAGSGGPGADTAVHFYNAAGDGALTAFYDGTRLVASNAGGTAPPAGISLGAWAGNPANEPSRGDVAQILLYNRVLSASEQQAVIDYLQAKWASAIPDHSAVTIQPGATLDLGVDETIGSLAGGGTVNLNPGTLTVGRNNAWTTFTGDITGPGGLTKIGSGVQYLDGNNSYTGLTTVTGGYLVARNNAALGLPASGALVQDGATLQLEHGTGITISNEAATLNGNGVGGNRGALGSWDGNNEWTGPVTLASDSIVFVNQDTLTISGAIGGPGALTKNGAGFLALTGGAANTYGGMTTVADGKLILGKPDGVNAIPGDLTIANYRNWGGSNSGVELAANEQVPDDAIIYFIGTDWCGFRLEGHTETVGGLVSVSRGVVENSGQGQPVAVDGHLILDVASGGNYDFRRHMRDNDGSGATGIVSLTKQGPGTQTLGGDQIRYTGATTVTDGTLRLTDTTNFSSPIDNSATVIIDAATAGDSWNLNPGRTLSGDGVWIKTGPGRASLRNTTVTASGFFHIQEGIVRNDYNSSNWTGSTVDMQIDAGAALDLYADDIYVDALDGGGDVQSGWNQTQTLVIGVANGSGTFSGRIRGNNTSNTPGNPENGTTSLTKRGTGTQILSGVNTYTGPTNVDAGALLIAAPGSIASSQLTTVAPGAILGGDGTVGSLDIFGILAPGNSAGTLTAAPGSLVSMESGSTYEWEMGVGGQVNDMVEILGDLQIDPVMTLVLLDAGISTKYTSGARKDMEFDIFTYTDSTNLPAGDVGSYIAIDTSNIDLSLFIVWDDSTLRAMHDPLDTRVFLTGLHANPIPEPATFCLLGLGGLVCLRRRRRRGIAGGDTSQGPV